MREFGIQTMTEKTMQSLKSGRRKPNMRIQGVHTYDILANPNYAQAFCYYSAADDHREDLIVDGDDKEGNDSAQSDLVKLALNLAFIKEETIKKMNLTRDGLTNLSLAHRNRDQFPV